MVGLDLMQEGLETASSTDSCPGSVWKGRSIVSCRKVDVSSNFMQPCNEHTYACRALSGRPGSTQTERVLGIGHAALRIFATCSVCSCDFVFCKPS